MEIILWSIVIFGYTLCFVTLYKVFVFAFSLRHEVPFVASEGRIALEALKHLELKTEDRFIDIGSGDGKVVFLCEKIYPNLNSYTGIDFNSALIFQSSLKSKILFKKNMRFLKNDVLVYNYKGFNKVFLYMTTEMTNRIMNILKEQLEKGSIVASAVFGMGEFEKNNRVQKHKMNIGKKEINITVWKKL